MNPRAGRFREKGGISVSQVLGGNLRKENPLKERLEQGCGREPVLLSKRTSANHGCHEALTKVGKSEKVYPLGDSQTSREPDKVGVEGGRHGGVIILDHMAINSLLVGGLQRGQQGGRARRTLQLQRGGDESICQSGRLRVFEGVKQWKG